MQRIARVGAYELELSARAHSFEEAHRNRQRAEQAASDGQAARLQAQRRCSQSQPQEGSATPPVASLDASLRAFTSPRHYERFRASRIDVPACRQHLSSGLRRGRIDPASGEPLARRGSIGCAIRAHRTYSAEHAASRLRGYDRGEPCESERRRLYDLELLAKERPVRTSYHS